MDTALWIVVVVVVVVTPYLSRTIPIKHKVGTYTSRGHRPAWADGVIATGPSHRSPAKTTVVISLSMKMAFSFVFLQTCKTKCASDKHSSKLLQPESITKQNDAYVPFRQAKP
jgi:hypothetical protein